MIRAKVAGVRNFNAKLRRIIRESEGQVQKAIAASGGLIAGDAKRLIQRGSRSGVVRTVTKGGKTHQASAPGEPPKTDTGRLVSSIFVEISEGGLKAEVGSGLGYAQHLEFGTQKMAARPWLQPTFDKNVERVKKRVAKAIRAATRQAARKGGPIA